MSDMPNRAPGIDPEDNYPSGPIEAGQEPVPDQNVLHNKVLHLHGLRTMKAQLDEVVVVRHYKELADRIKELEGEIRTLAVESYIRDGSKAPVPGVNIRITKKLKYDPAQAVRVMIRRELPEVLDVNETRLKALLKTGFKDMDFEIAEEEAPQATIASMLNDYYSDATYLDDTFVTQAEDSYMTARFEKPTATD